MRGAIEVTRLGRCRQRTPSGVRVESELCDERIGSGKAHGVAEPCDERHVNAITVKITVGIEEVRFDATALVPERRAPAKVHHTIETSVRSLDAHGIHAVGWQ